LITRLKNILEKPFTRLTYTQAIEILQADIKAGVVKFDDMKVDWGIDLGSEHERYLAEKKFKGPIIVTNYPKDIKAFYMKLDEGGKTVQAMDILVPRIGEIIGGSVREDSYEKLLKRSTEMGIHVRVGKH
jgi:asparaginyl-tRNA synthetase